MKLYLALGAIVCGCSLAWVYLREALRAWGEKAQDEDSAPGEGEPAPAES